MVNFKICIRNRNKNGFWPVYIRLIHKRKVGYMKTRWVVDKQGLSKNGSVKDVFVLEECSRMITEYIRRLNGLNISHWGLNEVKCFLSEERGCVSFSAFARGYIATMKQMGHVNNARLYQSALNSFESYFNSAEVAFCDIDQCGLEGWLVTLHRTKRALSLYPKCMRVIFKKAERLSMDPNSELPKISYNPWDNIRIPDSGQPEKRAIGVEECKRFFSYEIAMGPGKYREELGRDMALLSFSLAGINTVDLFDLKKEDYRGDVIGYHRSKTRTRRKDGAYFEMHVNATAAALIEKYKAPDDSDLLLCFGQRYNDARSFNAVVNAGIKRICAHMGISEKESYSFYSFRHTWATVAMNCCNATLSEIGFAMNHVNGDSVTRGYIKIDFTPAWKLNERVNNFIFGENDGEEDEGSKGYSEEDMLLVSPKAMVYARAYFRGEVIAEVSDIGFGTVAEVISRLAGQLSDTILTGCAVQFRIKNVDNGREAVYERTKGKGF